MLYVKGVLVVGDDEVASSEVAKVGERARGDVDPVSRPRFRYFEL
jgi:hypothetical protein